MKLLIVAVALVVAGVAANAQQPVTRFDVVSIKPCSGAPGAERTTPGRLRLNCVKAAFIVQAAFTTGGLALLPPLVGAPDWLDSERFDVEATVAGTPSIETMYAMLQPVLEERLKLKARRETREISVYALARSGNALTLKPSVDGVCDPLDPGQPRDPTRRAKLPCAARVVSQKGPNAILEVYGATIEQFCRLLTLDRPVLDQTGISGRFDFHLEFAGDERTSGVPRSTDPAAGPSIFTAVQEQLGLRLTPSRGPGDVVVIEHVERPSEN